MPPAAVAPHGLPAAIAHRAASRLIGGKGIRPAGLALRLEAELDRFTIVVIDEVGAPLMALGPFAEEEVVAVWRGLGAASGLPLLITRADGRLDAPYPQIGRLQLGPIRIRRRHGLLNGRRPRFLVRRKTGRFPPRPRVHREPEIFAGGR